MIISNTDSSDNEDQSSTEPTLPAKPSIANRVDASPLRLQKSKTFKGKKREFMDVIGDYLESRIQNEGADDKRRKDDEKRHKAEENRKEAEETRRVAEEKKKKALFEVEMQERKMAKKLNLLKVFAQPHLASVAQEQTLEMIAELKREIEFAK
ncbi:unnamed protein product [Mucor hiemalis]